MNEFQNWISVTNCDIWKQMAQLTCQLGTKIGRFIIVQYPNMDND